jgi:AcrR family transcriptional regulator
MPQALRTAQTGDPGTQEYRNSADRGPRSDRYERKLALILKAASEVIAENGFDGASVRAVAARANISLSGIYYYFTSKEQLLFALQRHTFISLNDLLGAALERHSNPEDRLRALIENHIKYFVNNMDSLKVCAHELNSLSGKPYEWILEYRRQYFDLARQVISELSGDNAEDAALSTLFLFGSLNWVHMWYDDKEHSDTEKLCEKLTQIYLHGLSGSKRSNIRNRKGA